MKILLVLVAALILAVLLIVIHDITHFHTVHYELVSDKVTEDFHFVFLSDLHNKCYGKNNGELLAEIDRLAPQAVLIGGDLLTAVPGGRLDIAADLVKRLMEKYPVYYANGNHEHRLKLYPHKYGDMARRYREAMISISMKRLVNKRAKCPFANIDIIGSEVDRIYYKKKNKPEMTVQYLDELLPKKKEGAYTILLAHNPAYFKSYAEWGADLVLSGHAHGGIARLPLLGGVISPELKLFPHYDGGIFHEFGSTMILSRGLGSHTLPIRFLNPGELVDVTIRAEGRDNL